MIETPITFRILLLSLIVGTGAIAKTPQLLTGKELQAELQRPGTIYWSDLPLREALQTISQQRRVPVWIDRRCVPHQPVNLVSNAALIDSLWDLRRTNSQLDIAWSEELVYVGPPEEANRWATVNQLHRAMLKKLPRTVRQTWLNSKAWRWERLTNPEQLMDELEAELGNRIEGREVVRHDLWPAAAYPPMPLFVRLELLLAGYGHTFIFIDDGKAVIRRMPKAPRVTLAIPPRLGDRARFSESVANVPSAKLSPDGRNLTASWLEHEQLRRSLPSKPAKRKRPDKTEIAYTLQAKDQPVEPLMKQLAKQLQLECEFTPSAKSKGDRRVSFAVENVNRDELLRAILAPAGLESSIINGKIIVTVETIR